ncbi:MAG: aminotransferase class I and II [Polyangiaceae bacterium]|nr:aminotransferase class I and II [Polyangiaceae bacterium]
MLRTVTVTRYVMPFREGGSVPALVEADDLGFYVVKLRGAAQGEKALVAELVGGELARVAGLPVPDLVFVDVDASLATAEPDPEIALPLEASTGLNLGMDYLPGSITFDPLAGPAPDPLLASRIVLFDSFVMNVDRTPRNPNLLSWHRRLWMIDHGACLYVHHGWTPSDVLSDAADPFTDVRSHVLLRWATKLEEAMDQLTSALTPEAFERICSRVPDAWLSRDDGFDGVESRRRAYVEFLVARRDALPRITEEADRARRL